MTRFLVRRILFGILVMWIITTIVFAMFFVAPHDPARLIAGREATAATLTAVRHNLGLDQPIPVQYLNFINRLLHGDLGYSYYSSQPVTDLLATRLPVTASLAIGGAVLWLLIGVGAGMLAATRPRSTADRAVTGFALFFYSMPTFLLGLLFLYFLSMSCTSQVCHSFPAAATRPSVTTLWAGRCT